MTRCIILGLDAIIRIMKPVQQSVTERMEGSLKKNGPHLAATLSAMRLSIRAH